MTALFLRLLLVGALGVLPAAGANPHPAAVPRERAPTPDVSPNVAPAKGVLLVAKPGMADPRFQETVVLLLNHDDRGTLGLIINRPTELHLSRLMPDLEAPDKDRHALYFGGPVGLNLLVYLVRSKPAPQQAQQVMEDVYYGADRDVLRQLLTQRKDGSELRLYIGHSGWAPGQLAGEIARGDWLLVEGDPRTVFERDLETIWRELGRRQPPPGLRIEAPPGLIRPAPDPT